MWITGQVREAPFWGSRTVSSIDQCPSLGRVLELSDIDAIIMIGGFSGYQAVWEMLQGKQLPAFKIPIVTVTASSTTTCGRGTPLSADAAQQHHGAIMP